MGIRFASTAFTPNLYQCAISINGVSDINEMLDHEKDEYGSDHWLVSYWEEVIKNDNIEKDLLKKISPINYIEKINTPILLIHGEIDKVVPMSQSEKMYDELDDEDKDVTFIELEDEGHYLLHNKTRLYTLKAIDKFIHKHLSH